MPKAAVCSFVFPVTRAPRSVSLDLVGDAVFVEFADEAPGGAVVQLEIPAQFLFRWVDAQRAATASK